MKISLKETEAFDLGAFKGNVYVHKDENRAFTSFFVDCLTKHHKVRLTGTTRVYFVMEGSGTFTINERTISAEKYDFFLIKDGDTYSYMGTMKLFSFSIPAADLSNEEKLD